MAGNPSMYSPKYFSKDYSKPYYGSKALKNLVSSNLYWKTKKKKIHIN